MNGGRNRIWIAAIAILVITLAGGALWSWRTNPHLKSLVSDDPDIMCHDDEIRRGELEAAGPDAVPFLREQLRREPSLAMQGLTWLDSRGVVAWIHDWVSGSLGDSIAARLQKTLLTHIQATESLLLLGPDAVAARPELTMRAAGGGSYLSGIAFAALTALSPTDPSTVSNYLVRLSGNNQPERFHLVRDFPLIWRQAPPHLHALVDRLQDADSMVRKGAAKSLAYYGTAAAGAVPRLQEMLTDPDRRGRPTAAYALGIISSNHADLAVAVMLEQQQTNNAWTGDLAHQLYAALGPAARRAEPALRLELSRSATNGFSGPPAFALWRVSGEASPEIITGLTRGCTQGIQRFQIMSLKGLREIGPPASNAVPVLRRLRSSPHWTIQRLADDALNRIHPNETPISRTPTD